jgi:hypothetical protein
MIATFSAIFVATFTALLLPLFLSGKQVQAAQEKARAHRLREAKLNARLLRLNI